jgi:hypothetical protein
MASGGKGDPFRERLIVALVVTLLAGLNLVACGQTPSSALSPTASPIPQDWITFQNQSTETVFIETVSIPLENCNGNRPAMSETTRERSTTTTIQLGVSGGLEAGIPEVVKVTLAAEFNISEGETRSASQNVRVEVDPGTQVTYQLTWYESWQVGDVVIDNLNLTIPYRVRTGVQSELRSGSPQACPTTTILSPATPTETPTLTLTPAPTDTPTLTPRTPALTDKVTDVPTDTDTPTLTPTVPSPTDTATVAPIPTYTATQMPTPILPTDTPTLMSTLVTATIVPTCIPTPIQQTVAPSVLTVRARATETQIAQATRVTYTPVPPPILTVQATLTQAAISALGCSVEG